jgi:hypothetical protein
MSENGKKGRGFAGLDSLLSVVDDAVPSAAIAKLKWPSGFKRNPSTESGDNFQYTAASEDQYWNKPSAGMPRDGKLFLGVAGWLVASAIVGFIVIIFNSSTKAVAPQRYSDLAPSPAVLHHVPVPAAKTATPPAAPPPTPAALNTEMPPVGSGLRLETSQIRYCLIQDARLNGIRSIINRQSNQEINDFNASLSDFNSRCGQFRYRRDVMASIRSEIETHRHSIEDEAQKLWLQLHPKISKSQAPSTPKRDNIVPNPARPMQTAKPFRQGPSINDSIGTGIDCNRSYDGAGTPCARVNAPQGKRNDGFGIGLNCDFGYRSSGGECVPIGIY